MSGLRTLWVTNDFPPRPGGIEYFVANLVQRVDPQGTRVLTSGWEGAGAHDAALPYPVERLGPRPLLPTPAVRARVRAAVREHRPDVVVFGAAWPLGELAAGLAPPTFALTHGHEAGMARVGLGRLVRRALAHVDAAGTISAFTRRALEPWADGTPLHHLPPGVDTHRFRPDVDGSVVRARHDVPARAPLVTCISRLVARKGQDRLVEAWPHVRARVPRARLLLVGEGPRMRSLNARREALLSEDAVTVVGGVPSEELPAYHAAADLFAMPCRSRLAGLDVEGLGIVYLEAQASGVPVVAGRSGGAPEALADGASGLVVDGASPVQVADAVADLLADEPRRRVMGAAGRARVAAEYDWDVVANRLRRILAGVAR